MIHMIAHFLLPIAAARLIFPDRWKTAAAIMVATMAVDLDHLLADPIYDPNRCSIGFHPLHGAVAIGLYLLMSFFPVGRLFPAANFPIFARIALPIRAAGIGLLIHMIVDGLECLKVAPLP